MKLRTYQRDQVLSVFRELATHQSTLVVSATGTGKTVTMAFVSEVHLRQGGKRVLILCPRDELISQARRTLLRAIPRLRKIDIGIEKAEARAASGTPIVLASPQSLRGRRLRNFHVGAFSLVIVDEAHLGGDDQQATMSYWSDTKLVGFTATPDRLDGRPLIPDPYESVAHVYELGDAIRDGYLSPLKFRQDRLADFDVSGVAVGEYGDFVEKDLERAATKFEALVASAASVQKVLDEGRKKVLVFCVTVAHAQMLAEVLVGGHVKAAAMDGEAPRRQRRDVLERFLSGDLSALTNCMLYTYGLDVPEIDAVILARPTMSRALYSQMVGRGARKAAGKEDCLVVDLVGLVGSHRLVTPEEALRPSSVTPVTRRPGQTITTEGQAAELAALEALVEIDADAATKQAAVAEIDSSWIDPDLALFGLDVPERTRNDRNATAAQIDALERAGISGASLLSFEQAHALFEQLAARWAEGLCTLKQGRLLARKGLDPNATMERASWAIEKIKANHWRTPPEVVADPALRLGGAATVRVRGLEGP